MIFSADSLNASSSLAFLSSWLAKEVATGNAALTNLFPIDIFPVAGPYPEDHRLPLPIRLRIPANRPLLIVLTISAHEIIMPQ
jgi:hypothetical protein